MKIEGMKKEELAVLCDKFGMSPLGTKDELISRLSGVRNKVGLE